VVRPVDTPFRSAAAAWAGRLGLPVVETPEVRPAGPAGPVRVVLEVGRDGLGLRLAGGPTVTVSPRSLVQRMAGGRDLLLRAVGRLDEGATVVDATAGLGADAFHLASRGIRVVMVEREPLVAALLEDALHRARSGREGASAQQAAERLTLLVGDAREVLGGLDPAPAVVVLDPMYPNERKRSRPNKGMALFRALVGGDIDGAEVLEAALRLASRRVVVKRPLRGLPLGSAAGAPRPTGSVMGTTIRYDLYAPRSRST